MEMCDVCTANSGKRRNGTAVVATERSSELEGFETMNMFPSTPTRRKSGTKSAVSVSATAQELKDLSEKVELLCPVRSVAARKQIGRHGGNISECYKGRCLKCGGKGHQATDCKNILHTGGGCYQCNVGKVGGEPVHRPGTFGRRGCLIKRLISLVVVSWEVAELRSRMQREIPEVAGFKDTASFGAWLNGEEAGVAIVVPWVCTEVLGMSLGMLP